MALNAVTLLVRSEIAARLTSVALRASFGCLSSELEAVNRVEGTTAVLLNLPGLVVQLLVTPYKWQWRERKTFPAEQLRMLSAHLGDGEDVTDEALQLLETLKRGGGESSNDAPSMLNKVGSFLKNQIRGGGYPLSVNTHLLAPSSSSSSSSSSSPSLPSSLPEGGLRLKELVVGADDAHVFAKNEALLASLGLRRLNAAPSVWRCNENESSSSSSASEAALRLLPSRYSALIVRSSSGGDGLASSSLENEKARVLRNLKTLSAAAGSSADILADLAPELSIYGQRRGDESSGQLVFLSNALAGLDLRLCAAPGHSAVFSEHQDAFYDQIDPNLNYEQDGGEKNHSPGCSHVVAKVNLSIAKQKLGIELR